MKMNKRKRKRKRKSKPQKNNSFSITLLLIGAVIVLSSCTTLPQEPYEKTTKWIEKGIIRSEPDPPPLWVTNFDAFAEEKGPLIAKNLFVVIGEGNSLIEAKNSAELKVRKKYGFKNEELMVSKQQTYWEQRQVSHETEMKNSFPYRYYLLLNKRRNPFSLTAFVVPGLPQIQSQMKKKGSVMLGAGLSGASVGIAASVLSLDAYSEYLRAEESDMVSYYRDKKNTYSTYAFLGGAVYVISAIISGLDWYNEVERKNNQ